MNQTGSLRAIASPQNRGSFERPSIAPVSTYPLSCQPFNMGPSCRELVMKQMSSVVLILAALGLTSTRAADHPGHCNYLLDNMWQGPTRACDWPTTLEQCAELGSVNKNKDAAHGPGNCLLEGHVGICDLGALGKRVYYQGDPAVLDIACGSEGGEWRSADGNTATRN